MTTGKIPAEVEMEPIPVLARATQPRAVVLAMMEREGAELAVVTTPLEELIGVVLRASLQNGCASAGHNPSECTVQQHLKQDVIYAYEDEPSKFILNGSPDLAEASPRIREIRARARARLPAIVVDEYRRPIGLRGRQSLR